MPKFPFKCECGLDNCYGEIRGFKHLPKDVQEKIVKYADEHVAEKYYESLKESSNN